ncbi:MAG TPA: hypothetical protein VJ725_17130 [Thermoanaerobaculia bacterium]|nr:hypothetical protein [Thermoanaerobaculia bacterium]
MEQELIASADERFREASRQIEALRSDLHLVAKGVLSLSTSFQVLKDQMAHEFQALESRIQQIESWRDPREVKDLAPLDIIREKLKNNAF